MSQTETIDKLYLELSQFTTAKTAREIKLIGLVKQLVEALNKARRINTWPNAVSIADDAIIAAALDAAKPALGEMG